MYPKDELNEGKRRRMLRLSLFIIVFMDKILLVQTIEEAIKNTDYFLVDVRILPGNEVIVEIDNKSGVDLDFCAALNRKIEAVFDRDVEDYSLEVGSAGLTAPFKVRGQYEKNLNNTVEVLTKDGRKLYGVLVAVEDSLFTIEMEKKIKPEGAKKKILVKEQESFAYDAVKYVKYDFKV